MINCKFDLIIISFFSELHKAHSTLSKLIQLLTNILLAFKLKNENTVLADDVNLRKTENRNNRLEPLLVTIDSKTYRTFFLFITKLRFCNYFQTVSLSPI